MTTGPVLGVDVGGTFIDVVLVTDSGVTTVKRPAEDDQSEGVVAGIQAACEQAGIEPEAITRFRHGTTVTTNAMLEGMGARTALVTTEGFADVLEIGRQNRPALYDIDAERPDPLVPARLRYELDERATPDGIEREVDDDDVGKLAQTLREKSVESVAVSLLHAYAHPENEARVAETLQTELDVPVVTSHETLAEFREYERTATTVADAAVRPVIERYLDALLERTDAHGIERPAIVQSNGGIADAETVRTQAVTTVLSGPAAGVVGAALFEPPRLNGAITLDMGGTSTDVGLVRDGTVERTTDAAVGGHPVCVPMVDIETVGAGGGSIAWVDAGGALRVGPQSAGADPGPACYGRGGQSATVTDAALGLGYLGPETVLGDHLELDAEAARSVLTSLARAADLDEDDPATQAARGIYRVVNTHMTQAIRRVTLERGHDPREFALVAFGGAGPMHATALADNLGIETVVIPRASGVLSALGMVATDERHDESRTYRVRLDEVSPAELDERFAQLTTRALSRVSDPNRATVTRRADLRYAGQSHELTVTMNGNTLEPDQLREKFHAAHERHRSYRLDDPIDLLTLRVSVSIPGEGEDITHIGSNEKNISHERQKNGETVANAGREPKPIAHREAVFDERHETPVYDRDHLPVGTEIAGPAILAGGESTAVLPPDWRANVDEMGTVEVTRR